MKRAHHWVQLVAPPLNLALAPQHLQGRCHSRTALLGCGERRGDCHRAHWVGAAAAAAAAGLLLLLVLEDFGEAGQLGGKAAGEGFEVFRCSRVIGWLCAGTTFRGRQGRAGLHTPQVRRSTLLLLPTVVGDI